MLALRFPALGLPLYPPADGVPVWGMHVMWLCLLGAVAVVVGQTDRWLGAAVGLAALVVFYRGAQLDPTSSVMFATGALFLTLVRQTPARYHRPIIIAFVGLALFQVVYVAHQMLGYDFLWAGMWGQPTSAIVQPIGTLGTVDGVGAYLAITAPLMPFWALPAVVYLVWAGHSLSALLALAVGLSVRGFTRVEAVVVHPRRPGPVTILWRRQAAWIMGGLGLVAFGSMAYLKGLATPAIQGRFAMWKFGGALGVSSDPVLGWGLGGWAQHVPIAQMQQKFLPSGEAWQQAHNEYLQWLTETGLVGVVLLCGWLWTHRAMVLDRTWGGSIAAVAVNAIGFFPLHVVPIALVSIICVGLATPARQGAVT